MLSSAKSVCILLIQRNIFIRLLLLYETLPVPATTGAILDKCALAIALQQDDSNIDINLADQWVCLAEQLSNGNTSAVNSPPFFGREQPKSKQLNVCHPYNLGIFQISTDWCQSENDQQFGNCERNGCQLDCSKLLDDDITDDIKCMQTIYELHGFSPSLWPSTRVEECQRGIHHKRDEWNITECLNDHQKRRKRRLTSIPLWSALLIVAISCLSVFVLTYFFYRYRRNSVTILSALDIKHFKFGRVQSVTHPLRSARTSESVQDTCIDEPYNAEYEVSSTQFAIDHNKCLGSGAYGVVYKALCKGKVVAVKTVKPNASKEYLQSLLGEIKILSHIGRHDFIVNLEGAYTRELKKGTVYVFMELCGLGNLEKFLKSNRNNYVPVEQFDDSNVDFERTTPNERRTYVTMKHLLQYAHQISKGMEFLSSKQVIHSDLAARNILLVDYNLAKISDFGLSRKLYGYINYIKKKEEPLPWRWMAPESLKDLNFSTLSDVWMYGVLLFEIFSLGELPYPGLSWSLEFVNNLENGFRMLKPKHAPDNMYQEVMMKCWATNPAERPSFSELSNHFYEMLHTITARDYIDLVDEQLELPTTGRDVIEES